LEQLRPAEMLYLGKIMSLSWWGAHINWFTLFL